VQFADNIDNTSIRFFFVGRAVGAAAAGPIYDRFGPRIMFRAFGMVSVGYLFVLVACFTVMKSRRPLTGETS
jgi:MFS family permease